MLGTVGYPLYVGALWYYDRTGHSWFPLLSGAIIGTSGGFLWTAAAYVQFSYAEEKDKALVSMMMSISISVKGVSDLTQYISTQWMLKSLGAIVGSSISLSMNIHQTKTTGVGNALYIVFIAIHSSAFLIIMLFIVHPKKVVRADGTHIALFKPAKFWPELIQTVKVMLEWKYLLLLPAQLVCEMA